MDAVDLSFRVRQREGIGISLSGVINPHVNVGGTLASPVLESGAIPVWEVESNGF